MTLREIILDRIQQTLSRECGRVADLPDLLDLKSDEELLAWHVGLFNGRHPVGTRVRYTHPRDGQPHVGSTVSRAFVAEGRGAVVLVSGCLCLIDLARVEPLPPAEEVVDGDWFPRRQPAQGGG